MALQNDAPIEINRNEEIKMKTTALLLSLGVTLAAASSTVSAHQVTFEAADNSPGTELCMAVASNKPLTIQRTLKENHMPKQRMMNVLKCNDMSVGKFVAEYGLTRSANMLNLTPTPRTSITDLAQASSPKVIVVSGS